MRRTLSSIGFIAALLCPCAAFAQAPPASCTTTSQNLWVRDQLNSYYYWYRFMPAGVNPASYNSPEAYLDAVRYQPRDIWSNIQAAATSDALFNDGELIKYGFSQLPSASDITVLQVWQGSPAEEAGLARGDRIVEINGRSVAALVAGGTLGSAFGPDVVGHSVTIVFEKPSGERRTAQMVKRVVKYPTISVSKLFEVDGRKVGYIVFNTFVQPSTAALNDAFAALKAAGATELILDLRYNGGGIVDVAVHLGSLIGGVRTAGQPMLNWVYNDKVGPSSNRTTRFTNPDNALNLQRLVVIATRATASASELVINGLRPFMPVTIVGDATYGKPVGQSGFRFCDKVLWPITFSIQNANFEGDYFDGLPADCRAADDPSRQLGDAAEGSLAEALTVIRTGGCSPRSAAALRALRQLPSMPRLAGWESLINAQ
ncbi:MAG TPA: S41 family peptidase [Vicinamibacterales bacterium]|nr:S41 family peptidase [Vicinamibacterales bacterium]